MVHPASSNELVVGVKLYLIEGIVVEDIEKYRRFKALEHRTCELRDNYIVALGCLRRALSYLFFKRLFVEEG